MSNIKDLYGGWVVDSSAIEVDKEYLLGLESKDTPYPTHPDPLFTKELLEPTFEPTPTYKIRERSRLEEEKLEDIKRSITLLCWELGNNPKNGDYYEAVYAYKDPNSDGLIKSNYELHYHESYLSPNPISGGDWDYEPLTEVQTERLERLIIEDIAKGIKSFNLHYL